MSVTIKKSAFRLRVFQATDGTVDTVFGSDPSPVNGDGTAQKLLKDQDVVEVATVTDHVEPVTDAPHA